MVSYSEIDQQLPDLSGLSINALRLTLRVHHVFIVGSYSNVDIALGSRVREVHVVCNDSKEDREHCALALKCFCK